MRLGYRWHRGTFRRYDYYETQVWVRGKKKNYKKDWPKFQKCNGGLVRLDRDGEDVVADLYDIRRILGRGQEVSVRPPYLS